MTVDKSDPNRFHASKWYGGRITLEAVKLSAKKFEIKAKGAGACSEDQVMRAWLEVADQLSEGEVYEKETKVSEYEYRAPAPITIASLGGYTQHKGIMIEGHISLK